MIGWTASQEWRLNISKQSCIRTTRTSTCNSVLIVVCCTNCPSNHLDLFTCPLGSLRHQFDASRVSFKWLDGLQLPKYVVFIYLDLFSLGNDMYIDWTPSPSEATPVKLVVMDGVVMGPTHCAYSDCTYDLAQLKGGVLCVHHELLYGNLCHLCDCNNLKVAPTQMHAQHQNRWLKHVVQYIHQITTWNLPDGETFRGR